MIRFLYSFFFTLVLLVPVNGEEFFYKHNAGDRYRILSIVNQDVYINRELSHQAEIINRIAVELTELSDDDTGHFKAVFQIAEKTVSSTGRENFEWSREYVSEFSRNRLGYITIGDEYFMPVVRNVPVFPERELQPGDSWTADGYEVHDFRNSFGIEEPYRIPFTATYIYLGLMEWKGFSYPAFSVSYYIFDEPRSVRGRVWPRRIQGASEQIVYWDTGIGQAVAYEEEFRLIFELSSGMIADYRGRASAEMIEAPVMDRETIAEEIIESIQQLNIEGATVRVEEAGVTISIENIQFMPDSSELRNDEKLKLDLIIEILMLYPERDIQVSGHTALAGLKEWRDQLSLERAQSVADYLIEKNARTPDRIIIQGYGAERPVDDNDTESGRQRNRRVEITILEN